MHTTLAAVLLASLFATAPPGGGASGLAGGAAVAGPETAAATSPRAAYMDVEIWPEYDDPRVLLIYEGRLADSTAVPANFSFVVPAGAQPHMVGGIAADGGHVHAEYQTREREDGRVEIDYRLEVPTFYMELYYDPFTGGDQRSFTYTVIPTSDVDSLAVSVQHPRRAQDFRVSPVTQETGQDRNGFDYSILRFGAVAAGTPRAVMVEYRKTDRAPSVTPQQPATATTSRSGPSRHDWLVYLVAFVLVASVGAGLYPFVQAWRERRRPARPPAERHSGGPVAERGLASLAEKRAQRFCTHCGEELMKGARYCGMCGEPTRAEARRAAAAEAG